MSPKAMDKYGWVPGDREMALEAVQQKGHALRWMTQPMKCDPEVVLVAVAQDGTALKYAEEELRGNKDFVLAAVSIDGNAFRFASSALRADSEVVHAAVSQKGTVLVHASEELQASRELQLLALQTNAFVLHSMKDRKQEIGVMVAALERKGTIGKQARASLETSIRSVFPTYTSTLLASMSVDSGHHDVGSLQNSVALTAG